MPDTRPYRKLVAKIDEFRQDQRTWILEGGPKDWAAYREEVGVERAVQMMKQFMDEIEKEENQ